MANSKIVNRLKNRKTYKRNHRYYKWKGNLLLKKYNLESIYTLGTHSFKTCFAHCDSEEKTIEFSDYFLASRKTKNIDIWDTLLHEIAHANIEIEHELLEPELKPGKEIKPMEKNGNLYIPII